MPDSIFLWGLLREAVPYILLLGVLGVVAEYLEEREQRRK